MKITSVVPNQGEVQTEEKTIFCSYGTPVAAWISGRGCIQTAEKFGRTSRHINQWLEARGLDPETVPSVPQAELDALLK